MDTSAPPPPVRPVRLLGWIGFLYLASGLPNGLATDTAPTLYALSNVDLKALGLLTLIELPWILKFLWAPAVDRFGPRWAWFLACQVAIVGVLVVFSTLPGDRVTPATWACLYLLAAASATQDVAIDAYAIDATPKGLVGPANSVRVTAYRLAALVASSVLVGASGWLGWQGIWLAGAGCFVLFTAGAPLVPRAPRAAPVARGAGAVIAPFAALARRPGFVAVAAFVLLYKVGDYGMARMMKPSLKRAGFDAVDLGWVGSLQVVTLICGAALGGALTRRWGVVRALFVLGAFQAVSNLAYAWGADHGKAWLWFAACVEPFCGGLGTAPFLSFLMLCCQRAHAATQFALFTAVMAVGRLAAGALSGYGAAEMGFAGWFAATFVAALPAFAVLPFARHWVDAGPPDTPAQG